MAGQVFAVRCWVGMWKEKPKEAWIEPYGKPLWDFVPTGDSIWEVTSARVVEFTSTDCAGYLRIFRKRNPRTRHPNKGPVQGNEESTLQGGNEAENEERGCGEKSVTWRNRGRHVSEAFWGAKNQEGECTVWARREGRYKGYMRSLFLGRSCPSGPRFSVQVDTCSAIPLCVGEQATQGSRIAYIP